MSGLVVDLLFQGELLRTVPFDRPALRIGRMRENDIVVDSPAVSRFHARLQLDAGRVFLEDGGSENGTLVNDRRVRGRQELAPGDRILLGKHELRVRSRRLDEQALVDAQTAPPELLREDAAEGAMDELRAANDADRESASVAVLDDSSRGEFDFEPTEFVDPEDRPEGADEDEVLVAAWVGDEATDGETGSSAPQPPVPAVAELFAGLIVQRDGRIERVVPWEGDAFTVGRSSESDLVLPQDEVSRKHARFVRTGDRYEVHDLGSVNGTLVNGSRVDVHALVVGDVITIEGFELTFVLDREPIAGAMKPSPDACPKPPDATPEDDACWEVDALAVDDGASSLPGVGVVSLAEDTATPAGGDATIANVMLEEDFPGLPGGPDAIATPVASEEGDLEDGLDDLPFMATSDSRKELAAVQPRGSTRAASLQDLGSAAAPARIVTLELRLRLDQLAEPLRRALEEAGVNDLVIPADLRFRTD